MYEHFRSTFSWNFYFIPCWLVCILLVMIWFNWYNCIKSTLPWDFRLVLREMQRKQNPISKCTEQIQLCWKTSRQKVRQLLFGFLNIFTEKRISKWNKQLFLCFKPWIFVINNIKFIFIWRLNVIDWLEKSKQKCCADLARTLNCVTQTTLVKHIVAWYTILYCVQFLYIKSMHDNYRWHLRGVSVTYGTLRSNADSIWRVTPSWLMFDLI